MTEGRRARLLRDVHTRRGAIPAGTVVDITGGSPEPTWPELVEIHGAGITALVDRAVLDELPDDEP